MRKKSAGAKKFPLRGIEKRSKVSVWEAFWREAIEDGVSFSEALKKFGLSWREFVEHLETEEGAENFRMWERVNEVRVEESLAKKALDGRVGAAKVFLVGVGPEKWSERLKVVEESTREVEVKVTFGWAPPNVAGAPPKVALVEEKGAKALPEAEVVEVPVLSVKEGEEVGEGSERSR